MGKYPWSGKRTLEHCGLITKMGGKPRQQGGKCDGFQKSADNDEPCNICMKCNLNTFYEEQEKMREILFRGKCIDDTCLNGKWLYGYILHDGVTSKHYIHMDNCLNESDKIGEKGLLQFVAYEVDGDTVCRYIGVPDKNGKEIYEKDIVLIDGKDEYFVIEWDNDTARFVMTSETLVVDFDNYWGYQTEVIGNIFDNSELIRK